MSDNQWGKDDIEQQTENEETELRTDKVIFKTLKSNTGKITFEELEEVIRKLKRRKKPGPDNIPMEIYKELNKIKLWELLEELNKWWKEEDRDEEQLKAKVVLIFKKGDSSKWENYRPISLLNSIHKIFTAIVKLRIEDAIDDKLQKHNLDLESKEVP